jgi:GTP-binding protein Era
VRTTSSSQIVLLDTPGVHKPRTALGERTNRRALDSLAEVDVICLLVDATAPIGPGDRFIAGLVQEVDTAKVVVVNKMDRAPKKSVAERLVTAVAELGDFNAYVPLSARTGEGADALVDEIEARLPEGPLYYPQGTVSDHPETTLAAELLREKLLAVARDELPHSITVAVEDAEERDGVLHLDAIVRVERESQKGMVIGRGGENLKVAGTAARRELEALLGTRIHLQTRVRVDKDWQRRSESLDRLGY